jgi:hypothetical protein
MRERAPARIAGFSRTDRCSHEREPGLGRSRSQANAGAVAIRASHRERRHPRWKVTAALLGGKAIDSAPRGRDQCSGSQPAERCPIGDASGVPATSAQLGWEPLNRSTVANNVSTSKGFRRKTV